MKLVAFYIWHIPWIGFEEIQEDRLDKNRG
jgi:hypothetical protein